MGKFVLVHGAWHGGWAWDNVKPVLERAGHEVDAPDLPGHGSDSTPISEVTLKSYVDRTVEALDASDEPVYLVGHSLAGAVIGEAAERRPEKIKKLVYVCAFMLQNGESALGWSQSDEESIILQSLEMSEDQSTATVSDDGLENALYNDAPDEVVEAARKRLDNQSLEPFAAQATVTDENFGRVPRIYIETTRDRAVSNSVQRQMISNLPVEKIHTMDTSHLPMASKPEELGQNLNDIAS